MGVLVGLSKAVVVRHDGRCWIIAKPKVYEEWELVEGENGRMYTRDSGARII